MQMQIQISMRHAPDPSVRGEAEREWHGRGAHADCARGFGLTASDARSLLVRVPPDPTRALLDAEIPWVGGGYNRVQTPLRVRSDDVSMPDATGFVSTHEERTWGPRVRLAGGGQRAGAGAGSGTFLSPGLIPGCPGPGRMRTLRGSHRERACLVRSSSGVHCCCSRVQTPSRVHVAIHCRCDMACQCMRALLGCGRAVRAGRRRSSSALSMRGGD